MLTSRTPPSDDHLFSVFTNHIKHIPGLATTMAHLKRIPYGRMDKNLQFLKDACLALVEEIRTDRQFAEVAKVYKNGGTDIALVMKDAEKKKAPCFAIRDGKTCAARSSCPYNHDTKIVAEAKPKAKAKAKAKPKAQPAAAALEKGNGKGKGKGKGQGKRICLHFIQQRACWLPEKLRVHLLARGPGDGCEGGSPERSCSAERCEHGQSAGWPRWLSDKPGRWRRQLSHCPPRASQCRFWILAPAFTW